MGNTQPLYESLNIPREKLFSNPLMLPNTLREGQEWIIPEESARADAGGKVDSDFYRERLRLRKAERILMLELQYENEYHNSYGVEDSNMKEMSNQMHEPSEATAESSMYNDSLEDSSYHLQDTGFRSYKNLLSRDSNAANAGSSRENRNDNKLLDVKRTETWIFLMTSKVTMRHTLISDSSKFNMKR